MYNLSLVWSFLFLLEINFLFGGGDYKCLMNEQWFFYLLFLAAFFSSCLNVVLIESIVKCTIHY